MNQGRFSNRAVLLCLPIIAVLALGSPANASIIVFSQFDMYFNKAFAGQPNVTPPPGSPAPHWFHIRIQELGDDVTTMTTDVTMTITMNAGGGSPAAFINDLYLNYNPSAPFDPFSASVNDTGAEDTTSLLVFTPISTTGSFINPTIGQSPDYPGGAQTYTLPPTVTTGFYDFVFQFDISPPADRFNTTDSITYRLRTPANTIGPRPRNFVSLSSTGFLPTNPFFGAAHVQGLAGDQSDKVYPDYYTWFAVPEPSTVVLFIVGIVGVVLMQRRRGRRIADPVRA